MFKNSRNSKAKEANLSEDELFLLKLAKKKKRNKIIKTVIGVALVVLFLFIIFNVVFGSAVGTKFNYSEVYSSKPVESKGKVDNEAGMTLFADNGILRMEYSPLDDLFIFTDIKSGEQFRSWPEPSEDEAKEPKKGSEYARFKTNHEIISSPVFVGYTQSGLEGGFILGVNQFEGVRKTVNKIENGIQFYYELDSISASFYVEFVLEGNSIVMNFPAEGLKEKKPGKGENQDRMPRMASISGLLYLTTARQGDEGYFVLPDGSGALTLFDSARVTSYDEYSKNVYGTDLTFESLASPDYNNVSVPLPVYGVVKNNIMVYSFATEGETTAAIQMANPGVRGLPFYSIGFKFQLRRFYYTQTTKDLSSFLQLETEMSVKSVQQKIFIEVKDEGEDFTYVDVANRTRDFLIEEWGGKTITDDADAINLKIFLGSENKFSNLVDTVKVMTTFDQVKEIYDELEKNNISDFRMSLLGWQKDGYFGICTNKFPVDKSFGGNKGLKDLTAWADEKGLTLSVENNLIKIYGSPSTGNSLRNSVVKEPGTSYLTFKMVSNAGVYRTGTSYYILSPAYYNKKFISKDIKQFNKLGVKNVDLLNVGSDLLTDYNKANARLRSQVADLYDSWIERYGEEFDSVSIYFGNAYAVKNADNIFDIPLACSTNFILDESIPFLQLVYHGLVNYYCEPINQADDMHEYVLKAVEYGAMLSYELTYNSTEELKYTYYNTLFRSKYTDLVNEINSDYDAALLMKSLRTEKIVNHYKLNDNAEAFCTEYSNGKKIYVNYEDVEISYNGITIPAESYVVG